MPIEIEMDTDVAIVGCGPVGAAAANLLGLRGLRVVILERERVSHAQPRAFSCDDEALRVYQAAGLVDEVRAHMARASVVHYTGVNGRKFAEIDIAGLDFGNGFPPLNFFYQPTLEAELRRGLRRFGSVQLHLGREVAALAQDAAGVTLDVREVGGEERWRVRAKFVLGCDGARSTVRRLAGIGLAGDSYPDRWLAVSGQPQDEGAMRIRDATFVCDPDRPTFVAEGAENDFRVEMMVNPGETDAQLEDPANVARLISPYVDPARFRITRSVVYAFHNMVAERWRDGRVFLLGDAAHQMPPMMGQGLVSGLRDAANLTWKLDLVLRGAADDSLLDSYETERRPHVKAMADASVGMSKVFLARTRWAAALRDRFFTAIQAVPRIRRAIRNMEFKPAAVYPRGAFLHGGRKGKQDAQGTMFPQYPVATPAGTVLSDYALGAGFALVVLGDAAPAAIDAWDRLGVRIIHLLPAGSAPREGAMVDGTGKIGAWFGARGVQCALVRPDRFVFAAGALADVPEIARWAERTFLSAAPHETSPRRSAVAA
ncbi:MAG TPA: bifunctional 3-(3-hydroxy-phenyl)propionate/3-hydroxycinnamic acid hydroxylase [Longimicrobium sp.]|nr:bifunctional 3-(3-hydroxy-phenyl)propionate/3-hydroxycinnamic acid hydroxylase [Longimicrobium sp.]